MIDDLDTIKEFLIESNENLTRLDQEIVELERDPQNSELVASIFRTIHTIKGTCGFLGFDTLTEVSHAAESILSQVRDGKRNATKRLIDIILQAVDVIKQILQIIEETGHEGENRYADLTRRLQLFAEVGEAEEAKLAAPAIVQAQPPSVEAPPPEPLAPVEVETQIPATSVAPEHDAKSAPAKVSNTGVADSTIRVDVGLLDKLMNLVGELVLARNQVLQYSGSREDSSFAATSQRLNLITSELQESVMKTRMQPIGIVWSKFPRVVRDLASSFGKQITLTMDGAETELDKTIIEAIKDPLTHIVRNSCDHGIEKPEDRIRKGKPAGGKLVLRAFHEGGHVNIEIIDDGAGLNPEKIKAKALQKGLISAEQAARMSDREAIQTIFLPGFSTAEQVSNISGRGVGMDVVKTNIEKIGGAVDLISGNGPGTTVKIKIPLTLAIIPGLVVTSGGERFVIPQMSLLELIRLEGESGRRQIERIHGTPVYRRRGNLLPLAFLNEVLQVPGAHNDDYIVNIVVLQAEDREFGLVVDTINDTQEIVVKPLGKQLKGLTVYSGATIMGDGRVVLILDVLGIAQRSGVIGETSETAHAEDRYRPEAPVDKKQSMLLFSAAGFERLAVPLDLVARLEEIPAGQIEHAAGKMVVQYRGQLLPLVSLASQFGAAEKSMAHDEQVQVVVFSRGEKLIGLVVDSIVDIIEEHVTVRRPSQTDGLLGSAVIGQKVTDFIDLQKIIANSGESWFDAPSTSTEEATVLLVEESAFMRALLRNSLEMEGYLVVEAPNEQVAKEKLAAGPVHAVAASTEFSGLAEYIRQNPNLKHLPLLGLTAESARHSKSGLAFDECQLAFEREAVSQSLERLLTAVGSSEMVLTGLEQ
jgi:two-component system, chemotaxis family, sensor kinase CheA